MSNKIISLDEWLQTPAGQRLLGWEQAFYDEAVADLFGFNAAQLGMPALDTLHHNRMPQRWLCHTHALGDVPEADTSDPPVSRLPPACALVCDPAALPLETGSMDLLTLPHTLEQSADPHQALREVARVLRPEGRVIISGLNPLSLWALRQYRAHGLARVGLHGMADAVLYLPRSGEFLGHWRLRDWLRLLSFDIEAVHFGIYQPAVDTERWLQRWHALDALGSRWWPVLGAAYAVVAVKRVHGMRLLGPAWKPFRAKGSAPAVVAGRQVPSRNGLTSREADSVSVMSHSPRQSMALRKSQD